MSDCIKFYGFDTYSKATSCAKTEAVRLEENMYILKDTLGFSSEKEDGISRWWVVPEGFTLDDVKVAEKLAYLIYGGWWQIALGGYILDFPENAIEQIHHILKCRDMLGLDENLDEKNGCGFIDD